jgi:hypothetical protein
MLGFDVSERTVSRLMPRRAPNHEAAQRWIAFLRNHRDAVAAMDFFVVPTVTLRVRYVWFVIEHGRRRIVHSTRPTSPTRRGSCSSCARRSRSTPPRVTSSIVTARLRTRRLDRRRAWHWRRMDDRCLPPAVAAMQRGQPVRRAA